MPQKKGTVENLTPKKASKRKIHIKRSSQVVRKKPTKTTTTKPPTRKKPSKAWLFQFTDLEGKKHSLTKLQYTFADLCIGLDKSPFDCVIEAGFNVFDDQGKLNKGLTWSIANQYLNMPKIRAYINKELASVKLNKEAVMLELAQMLLQKVDYRTKAKAMDMYFKLTGEYAPDKHEHQFNKELQEAMEKIAKLLP